MGSGDLLERGRRSVLATMFQKVATPVLTIGITVLLARTLSKHDYGVYGLFQGALKYLALFTSLGLTFVVQRFVPEFREKSQDGYAKDIVFKSLLLRAVAVALSVVVVAVAFPAIGSFLKIEQYRDLFVLFTVGAAFYLESAVLLQALNGLFLHAWAVAGQIIYTVAKSAMLALLLVAGVSLRAVVWVEVASFVVMFAVYAASYWWRYSRTAQREPLGGEQLKRVARYGGFSIVNEIGTTFFDTATDYLIIGHFMAPAAVAPYYLATQIQRYFGKLNIINQFQTVFTPMFFAAYAEEEERLDRMFGFLAKLSLFLTMPALAGFLLLGRDGLRIVFGAGYASAFPVTAVLLVFLPISALSLANGLVLQSLERVDILLYSRVFAVYNVVINVVLVQRFGVLGVAFGTASAVFLKNAYTLVYAMRLGKVRVPWGGLARLALNSAACGLIVWAARGWVNGIVSLAAVCGVAGLVFLAACYFNRVFSAEEASVINRVARRNIWMW